MARLLVFVIWAALPLLAQVSQVSGTISGVISDPSGSPVANVPIVATNVDTAFERNASTNERGEYEIPLLPLGTYRVLVKAPGFSTYQQTGIKVTLDAASQVNIALQVGSTEQTIDVNSDASVLTTESFNVGGNLDARSLTNLPITSRNIFNFALFAPGYNGTPDNEFGNPTFAFGGMQRRGFIMDGVDNTQRGGPGRLGIFSPEDIAQVKVLTNDMDAEYGRTVGGIISMVSKGGTNELHGEALVLERRPGLIARPSLAPPPKPFQQWATFSGNVAGPIVRDKLFYFVSGEYEPEDGANAITISRANAAALGLPASELATAPFKQRFQSYLGRLDYQLDPKNNFYFRYSQYRTPSKYNTSGGLLQLSAGNNYNDFDQTGSAQWTRIVSPRALNELRFGYLQRVFTRPPVNGVIGPIVTINNVAQLGSNSSAGQGYNEQQYNFIDNFSYTAGKHELKFGADIDTIRVDSSDRLLLQFSFANLNQYLQTIRGVPGMNYSQLTQQFGNNQASHRTTPVNFFAEDHWHVRPNLLISYGLRWEYLIYPSLNSNGLLPNSRNIPDDKKDFAPRLGFSWQPDSRTVIRGGYGIFYDTLNLRLLSLVDRSNGAQVTTYTINGNMAGAPVYPNAFTGPVSSFATKTSVYGFDRDFKSQYAQQANVQAEHSLGKDWSATLGVQWFGGHREPILLDRNLGAPTGVLPDGRPIYSTKNRPNPNFNQIFDLTSVGNSVYYGGFVGLAKRFSSDFQFTASYTLGWAFNQNDSVSDNGSSVVNAGNFRRDWAFSSSDQRNRFVLQGVWQPHTGLQGYAGQIVNGWTLAPELMYTSGFPYSSLAGSDLNGDGVNNDYSVYGSRNNFRGPGFQEVNLRLSRIFPVYRERLSLEIIGEAENLLNTTNAACNTGGCSGAINATYGPSLAAQPNSGFGQIVNAFNSRQIQLGARLRF